MQSTCDVMVRCIIIPSIPCQPKAEDNPITHFIICYFIIKVKIILGTWLRSILACGFITRFIQRDFCQFVLPSAVSEQKDQHSLPDI